MLITSTPSTVTPIPSFFFVNDTATTEIYTLSLHDALPIWSGQRVLLHQLTRSTSEAVTHEPWLLPFPGAGRPGYQSSRSRAWGRSRGLSGGAGGPPSQRQLHEVVVEPRLLRSLPETAFLLVEPEVGRPGARVRLGDCNPDILTLANVAAVPAEG